MQSIQFQLEQFFDALHASDVFRDSFLSRNLVGEYFILLGNSSRFYQRNGVNGNNVHIIRQLCRCRRFAELACKVYNTRQNQFSMEILKTPVPRGAVELTFPFSNAMLTYPRQRLCVLYIYRRDVTGNNRSPLVSVRNVRSANEFLVEQG